MRRVPLLARPRVGAIALGALAFAGCSTPPRDRGDVDHGVLSLAVDNDSYSLDDGNYSNGLELAWTSPALASYAEDCGLRRAADAVGDFLGLARHERRVALSLGQLIFTPENLRDPIPPHYAHPYAGILFVDTSLLAFDAEPVTGSTGVTLRLGLVGESSMAEDVQRRLHKIFGAERPRGWDTQLEDEPLLNLGLERHSRLVSGSLGSDLCYDLTGSLGAALGTYFTGASAGLGARIGPDLPRDVGGRARRTGLGSVTFVERPDRDEWQRYVFVEADGFGVARFLPLDGGVFHDGRSTEKEDFVGTLTLGFALAHRPFTLRLSYTLLSDTYEAQELSGQYGTIALGWFL